LAAADAPLTATKNSKVGIQNTKLGGLSRPEDSTQLHCKFIAFLTDRDFSLSNPRGNAPKLRVLSSALTWHWICAETVTGWQQWRRSMCSGAGKVV